MNFYAYYPRVNLGISPSAGDLTYETIIGGWGESTDILAANKLNVTTRPASSTVSFDFKHILSKVQFKLVVGNGMKVQIDAVGLKNIVTHDKFDFETLTWGDIDYYDEQADYNYKYLSAPTTYTGNGTSVLTLTGTWGSKMFIPNDYSTHAWDGTKDDLATGSYIEVVYRMWETASPYTDHLGYTDAKNHPDYDGSNPGNYAGKPLYIKVGYPLDTNWEMGKSYTYTIYLGTPNASNGILVNDYYFYDDLDASLIQTDLVVDRIPDPDNTVGLELSVGAWDDDTIITGQSVPSGNSTTLAPPGVIGYIKGTNTLTIRGSKEYSSVAGIKTFAETIGGLEDETVYVAYFKFGSLVALSSDPNDDEAPFFEPNDIIAAPTIDNGYIGIDALRVEVAAQDSDAKRWAKIPYQDSYWNATGQIPQGKGDPCIYYFGADTPAGNPYNGTNYSASNLTWKAAGATGLGAGLPAGRLSTNGSWFYPTAGMRNTSGAVIEQGDNGYYWSTAVAASTTAYDLFFSPSYVGPSSTSGRNAAVAVRCVDLLIFD
jgi:hypothetical protein